MNERENKQKIQLSQSFVIERKVKLPSYIKGNHRIIPRPSLVTQRYGDRPVMWRNDINGQLGFADAAYAMLFDIHEVESFYLENLTPAKGSGGSYLKARLVGDLPMARLFEGEYRDLDEAVPVLQNLTGKVVNCAEYNDC